VRIGAEMVHPALWCWFTAQLSRKRQISGVEVIERGTHVPLLQGVSHVHWSSLMPR
jgi:hypothetical protein